MRLALAIAVSLCAGTLGSGSLRADDAAPVRTGLLVLYDFRSDDGSVVRDRSGVGEPLDLKIADEKAVRRTDGALEVRGKTLIRSDDSAKKVTDAVRRSGEFTIEAWVRPANTKQDGPARIVTLSTNISGRNFTLGQDGNRFDVRFRTTRTSGNGLPSTSSPGGSLKTEPTHVVYTRDRSGRTTLFLNGKPVAEGRAAGDASNWDDSYRLALANELTNDRPWEGTYHLVALYGRSLFPREVERNFAAGPDVETAPVAETAPAASAVAEGLLALYDFAADDGAFVRDRSGVGEPLDLKIEDEKAVRRTNGTLEVRGKTLIRSEQPARKIVEAVRRTNEVTIEAWVQPANTKQDGPARIVTLSENSVQRNFTLGQERDRYDARFRSTKTSDNGLPSTTASKNSVETKLTHVVYTRDRSGRATLFLNGKPNASGDVGGDVSNWNGDFRLALANEHSGDRLWEGTYHRVAIYGRSLSLREVERNFAAGANATPMFVRNDAEPGAVLFEQKIAGLLANHCLECHDPSTNKGGLDLARKDAALAGGESGKAIVPGKPGDSLLWEMVASDAMPQDRPPLSADEKALLKRWIAEGATWTFEVIDPIVYAHAGSEGSAWIRRLTVPEYVATVKAAVGVDVEDEARELLPPELRADGFSNTAYNLNVDLGHVEAYAKLAEIVVERMDVPQFARRFSRKRDLTDDTMRALIEDMGKWLLRGPLEEREIAAYRGVSTSVASAGGDFDQAVGLVIQAMLQSPRFVYRIERQRGDGGRWPVDDYELASRLSYMAWGAPPDEELMQAAEKRELDEEGIRRQLDRMLEDPRAVERSKQFLSEWLNLGRLGNMQPDAERFPDWTPRLAEDMRRETLAFFEDLVWKQNRPLADLFDAEFTYATPELAEHYGLKPRGDGLQKYDLSDVPGRGGLLTQGSVLTVGGDNASMVTRGLFVLHDVLRGIVKDPPPCVDTTPVPSKPGLSQRGVAEARIANAACGGCHEKFEPLAFGLERFDGLGRYFERDQFGNELRDDGAVLFPGTAEPVEYDTSSELMDLLADSDRVNETVTWKFAQFALGRPLGPADKPILDDVHAAATKSGGTYRALLTALATSDLVRTTRTETTR